MNTQDEACRDGSAPAPQNETAVTPADWTHVVAAIGAHPDLHWDEWQKCWKVGGYGVATPATVDALMLDHCTAWLDANEAPCVVPLSDGTFYLLRWGFKGVYPTRVAATIAAVRAAKGAGNGN